MLLPDRMCIAVPARYAHDCGGRIELADLGLAGQKFVDDLFPVDRISDRLTDLRIIEGRALCVENQVLNIRSVELIDLQICDPIKDLDRVRRQIRRSRGDINAAGLQLCLQRIRVSYRLDPELWIFRCSVPILGIGGEFYDVL